MICRAVRLANPESITVAYAQEIENKHESGPTVTFADVTLHKVARVDGGFPQPWMHVAPIILLTEEGGLGGIWFESVRVIDDRPRPFLRW